MCFLQIHAQCYDRFFEVIPSDVENAEITLEHAMSHVLLDLFDEGTVDDVTIRFSSNSHMGLHHCSIHIHAQCACQSFTLLPPTYENMEIAVENSMSSILRELFGSVNVESVTFNHSPWDLEYDHSITSNVQ